jgi:hypothetical protein
VAVGVAAPIIPDDIFLTTKEEEERETDSCDKDHIQDVDGHTPDSLDKHIAAEVSLPHGGGLVRAKVINRKQDHNKTPIELAHKNPILDSRQYDVVFEDGSTNTFTANVIAENMYPQVDDEGHHFTIVDEIIKHKSDGSAVKNDDRFVESPNGNWTQQLTTKGWKLLVQWKDRTSSWIPVKDLKKSNPIKTAEYAVGKDRTSNWIPVKDLKESNPIKTAEYAVANKIAEEPAFAWWVRKVL